MAGAAPGRFPATPASGHFGAESGRRRQMPDGRIFSSTAIACDSSEWSSKCLCRTDDSRRIANWLHVLHHQPKRKSHGLPESDFSQTSLPLAPCHRSLASRKTKLTCHAGAGPTRIGPPGWQEIVERPLKTGFKRLLFAPYAMLRIFYVIDSIKLIYGRREAGCTTF